MDLSAYKSLRINGVELVRLVIGGVVAWAKKTFTNQVPLSTDTDGSIYNGVGYKDNTRLSSSGSVSGSAQAGSATTGFMPCTAYDIIRLKGATWLGNTGHYYVHYYDANKKYIGGFAASAYAGNYDRFTSVTYDAASGVTTFYNKMELSHLYQYLTNIEGAVYVRLNAYGKGADMVVTVNEEI